MIRFQASDIALLFRAQKGEALLYSTDEGAPLSQIHGGVFHDSANELTYLCVKFLLCGSQPIWR